MVQPLEESTRAYLEGRRWPFLGPICPGCGSGERVATLGTCTTRKPGFYRCLPCGVHFTVRTNTVMERSRLPLYKWVRAMFLLAKRSALLPPSCWPGGSCYARWNSFAPTIGVTQKTGRFVLERLREACGEPYGRFEDLDEIADAVLAYRPIPKSKSAKKRGIK